MLTGGNTIGAAVTIKLPVTGHIPTSQGEFDQSGRIITVKDVTGNVGTGPNELHIEIEPALDPVTGIMQEIDDIAGGVGGAAYCGLDQKYGCIRLRASSKEEVDSGYPHWSVIG